jgi:hypothetical protein
VNANTGKPSGQCAAVKAGLAHGADCTASNATSCGLDGKCDGAGACRFHPSGTVCAAESCTDGAQTRSYTSARTCNGQGVCAPVTTSDCGSAYRCSGTRCRTTCGGAPDCVPADYCAGTRCTPKKPDGTPCSSSIECSMGTCGGLCCAAGCSCTQPTVANVLKNPGIDKDTAGWTIDSGTLSRSLSDAERCPYSGSLITTIAAGGAERTVSQCVSNKPLAGNFNFGAHIQTIGGSGAGVICQAAFWSGFNCDGDTIVTNETVGLASTSGWQTPIPESSPDGTPVSGANSLRFSCYLLADPSVSTDFYLDMLYVAKVPNHY